MSDEGEPDGVYSESRGSKLKDWSSDSWITFEDPKEQDLKPFPQPPLASTSSNSEHYLSSLEKRLKKVQGKSSSGITSKDMLKSLEQAKLAHMVQMMTSKQLTEAYIAEEETNSMDKCFPVHRLISPKQPLSREEHECLIETETHE